MQFPLNTRSILAAFALSLPCAGTAAATPETAPGDRNPPVNQIYPPEAFHHNGKGGRVLDVTKPPSHAKGDGVTDDTQALSAAMWSSPSEHHGPAPCHPSRLAAGKYPRALPDRRQPPRGR
jgi:hypothetical protein